MGSEPTVSAVLPVRDGAEFLGESIASVLAQTHPAVELIVVDDGSTDDSAEIARSYGERLVLVEGPARGAGAARNRGVEAATGEFLSFIDADDVWPPERSAVLLDAFGRRPDADIVFGRMRFFPGDGEPVTALMGNALLLRRSLWRRVGGLAPEWKVGEFMDWFLKARELGVTEATIDDVVVHRRVHPDSLTARGPEQYGDYTRILRESLVRRRGEA